MCALSALSERSMLSSPYTTEVACGPHDAAGLRAHATEEPEGAVEVQVLAYDPLPFATGGLVDLCTMAMTVDRSDERVDSCMEEAVRKEAPWLMSMR